MDYKFKSIVNWPGLPTKERKNSPFRTGYRETLKLLDFELEKLNARSPVLIQSYHRERDIRIDGLLRPDAQKPDSPGVIITGDVWIPDGTFNEQGAPLGKYRPISFPCDKFFDWKDNLRAIALSLEALRKVDRYGVTKSGEQYRGWTALPPAPSTDSKMTEDEAAIFIAGHSGVATVVVLKSRDGLESAYRAAARKLHPDAGGKDSDFVRLGQAVELLRKRFL